MIQLSGTLKGYALLESKLSLINSSKITFCDLNSYIKKDAGLNTKFIKILPLFNCFM